MNKVLILSLILCDELCLKKNQSLPFEMLLDRVEVVDGYAYRVCIEKQQRKFSSETKRQKRNKQ